MSFQRRIWDNKIAKGFGTEDLPKELCLLQNELVEFREAERAGDTVAKAAELADVAIFVYAAAQIAHVGIVDLPLTKPEDLRTPEPDEMSKAIAAFFDAWQHGHLNILGARVQTLMWNCEALAYHHGIDLASAVDAKIRLNEKRNYASTAHGHVKTN